MHGRGADMTALGIRNIRTGCEISLHELAERTGWKTVDISAIEQRKREFTAREAATLLQGIVEALLDRQ